MNTIYDEERKREIASLDLFHCGFSLSEHSLRFHNLLVRKRIQEENGIRFNYRGDQI